MFKTGDKMRTAEAAAYLGISPSTLAKMRRRGEGPPFYRLGLRMIIYRRAKLDEWLDSTLELDGEDG